MSDWSENLKPVASKSYAELLKTYGQQAGAAVEALEIARRRAEIDQTERDWRERHGLKSGEMILATTGGMFKSLCGEFGPKRAVHILTGIEACPCSGRVGKRSAILARDAWGNEPGSRRQ